MDALKYLKEKQRICDKLRCEICPLSRRSNGTEYDCEDLELERPELCVDIVEKWSAEHPVKTRQSEFLKMFPNADLMRDGAINICPRYTDIRYKRQDERFQTNCDDCRKEYWLAEVD